MNLGFKIHSFDNSNSVPWEYYPTFADCEVGDVMTQFIYGGKTVVGVGVQPEARMSVPLYISMTKIAGLTKKNVSAASPENMKHETVAVVQIKNDMVIEGVRVGSGSAGEVNIVFPKTTINEDDTISSVFVGDTSKEANVEWNSLRFKELSAEPLGIEIDGQPAYKVLVRYIG